MTEITPPAMAESAVVPTPNFRTGLVLALAYPLLAHAAVYFRSLGLTCVAAGILLLLVLHAPLRARRAWAWLLSVSVATLLVFLALRNQGRDALYALYLAPVLIYLFLAWVFGRTLVGARQALITRLAWHFHGQPTSLSPQLQSYTRKLTALWTAAFLLLAAVNFLLALFATPDGILELLGVQSPIRVAQSTWSLFANFLSFGLVLLLFAVEFMVRLRRFPENRERYGSLFDFLSRMRSVMPGMWRDVGR